MGGVSVNNFCVKEIDLDSKAPTTGVPWLTRICVERDLAVNAPIASWLAVIVEVPAPTTFIVIPEMVATCRFEEVKTQGAGELVVGGTSGIVPTPYVVVIVGKEPKIVKVACAAEGTPAVKSEITTANNAKRWNFLDIDGEAATSEVNIVSLSPVCAGNLGFGKRGLCEIRAKN